MAFVSDLMYTELQGHYGGALSLGDYLAQFAADNPSWAGGTRRQFYADALTSRGISYASTASIADLAYLYWSNTPFGLPLLYVNFDGTGQATTPDAAGFSALTDFSVLAAITTVAATTNNGIIGQNNGGTNQRSWEQRVTATGAVRTSMSTNGTASTNYDSSATVALGSTYWMATLRNATAATIDYLTGTFAAASEADLTPPAYGSLVALGTQRTGTLSGALFNSNDPLCVGRGGVSNNFTGRIYRVILYSGIYGSGSESIIADFDPTHDSSGVGDTDWSDGTYTWTLSGGAAVTAA